MLGLHSFSFFGLSTAHHSTAQHSTAQGLRLDRLCGDCHRRQLGSELHELHPVLPLFDGVTGHAVPQHIDNRVERLRDALMDDARERVDDLGEDLVVGLAWPQPICF